MILFHITRHLPCGDIFAIGICFQPLPVCLTNIGATFPWKVCPICCKVSAFYPGVVLLGHIVTIPVLHEPLVSYATRLKGCSVASSPGAWSIRDQKLFTLSGTGKRSSIIPDSRYHTSWLRIACILESALECFIYIQVSFKLCTRRTRPCRPSVCSFAGSDRITKLRGR